MERISVNSSNIASVGYDADSQTLEIEFNNGGVYQYSGVPQEIYGGMMSADSKGKYFHANINKTYPFSKL
ncbi:MAG TPA: KTSC domain-containing protein [Acidobacteriaceae bacterium]|nr:KTSC domain-containing protein [Acidobacteriaceae bacterium]